MNIKLPSLFFLSLSLPVMTTAGIFGENTCDSGDICQTGTLLGIRRFSMHKYFASGDVTCYERCVPIIIPLFLRFGWECGPCPNACFEETGQELQTAVDSYLEEGGDDPNTNLARRHGHPIGEWCVSRVKNFAHLFDEDRNSDLRDFNLDIVRWNTTAAEDMSYMFARTRRFNQKIGTWVSRLIRLYTFIYIHINKRNETR